MVFKSYFNTIRIFYKRHDKKFKMREYNFKENLIIAIDFDGTIAGLSFPEVGPAKDSVADYINKLYEEGNIILINTCRTGLYEGYAQEFLEMHSIKYDFINSNHPTMVAYYKQDCRKIFADIYVDDKCLMGLPDSWEEIYNIIQDKKDEILLPRNKQ